MTRRSTAARLGALERLAMPDDTAIQIVAGDDCDCDPCRSHGGHAWHCAKRGVLAFTLRLDTPMDPLVEDE